MWCDFLITQITSIYFVSIGFYFVGLEINISLVLKVTAVSNSFVKRFPEEALRGLLTVSSWPHILSDQGANRVGGGHRKSKQWSVNSWTERTCLSFDLLISLELKLTRSIYLCYSNSNMEGSYNVERSLILQWKGFLNNLNFCKYISQNFHK